jgi:hypothetical protein
MGNDGTIDHEGDVRGLLAMQLSQGQLLTVRRILAQSQDK